MIRDVSTPGLGLAWVTLYAVAADRRINLCASGCFLRGIKAPGPCQLASCGHQALHPLAVDRQAASRQKEHHSADVRVEGTVWGCTPRSNSGRHTCKSSHSPAG